MMYTKCELYDGTQLVANDLTIDYQFRQVSVQAQPSVEWYGFILPPNSWIEVPKRYTLQVPSFKLCQIATNIRHPDGQVEFQGIGPQPTSM